MLSLYLDVAVASGWLGALCFLVFVWGRVLRLLRSSHPVA
jgi:energy-converting hydrogenase Eha subunit C